MKQRNNLHPFLIATCALVTLAGCGGSIEVDVSLREIPYTVTSEALVLNTELEDGALENGALGRVAFAEGCPAEVKVINMALENRGHRGVILPAGCSFQLPVREIAAGRLSALFALHRGDWLSHLERRRLRLPTVFVTARAAGAMHRLVAIDFSDPAIAGEPRWLERTVQVPEAAGQQLVIEVSIEPQDGQGQQARVMIADLVLESTASRSLSLEQEPRTVTMPAEFRRQVPRDADAAGLFQLWSRNRRLLHLAATQADTDSELLQALPSIVAAQEASFRDFSQRYSEELFWDLWQAIPPEVAPHPPDHPDLVLLVIDAARRDHFSCYGYHRQTTPAIDSLLAGTGYRFAEAYSTATATNYSMPTMMTSHYPTYHRFSPNGMKLQAYEYTLAEHLRSHGYVTLGVVTNPYLAPGSGMGRGYVLYDGLDHLYAPYPKAEQVFARVDELLPFLRWLPTYLYLHLMDVHGPYRPPPPFDRVFDGQPYTHNDNVLNGRVSPPFDRNPTFRLPVAARASHANVSRVLTLYDGELRYTDHHIGLFVQRLQDLGLLDQTSIVLTADHGEEFFEHGFTYHSSIPHEEKLIIPLIIRPHRTSPYHRERTVTVPGRVDAVLSLFPTIVDLAGLPPADGLHGRSLLPLIAENQAAPAGPRFHDLEYIRSAQRGPWKLILPTIGEQGLAKIPEWAIMGDYRAMLFNLDEDPGESHNLVDQEPATADQLRKLIADKFSPIAEERQRVLAGETAEVRELDEETRERLQALGYAE